MKKSKRKKRGTKLLALFMLMVLVISTPNLKVCAEEVVNAPNTDISVEITNKEVAYSSVVQPLTTMFDCEIIMAFTLEGLEMTFTTSCVDIASVIGVKDIKVQQKMWYGWKTVMTSKGAENIMKIFLRQILHIRMLLTEKHIELFAPTMLIMMVMKK